MKKIFAILSVILFSLGASAQTSLKAVVDAAIAAQDDKSVVAVFLDPSVQYDLNEEVALEGHRAVIWGAGATVNVSGAGQITTQTYLMLDNINFDCSQSVEGTAKALVALSANTPEELLWKNEEGNKWAEMFPGANQAAYHNVHIVKIERCTVNALKAPLFDTNKKDWALNELHIDNCMIGQDYAAEPSFISTEGSQRGCIKHLVIKNSTLYNIQINKKARFIRYGNASNTQAQKIWGTTAKADFVMENNTLVQMGNKEFANNYPNKAGNQILKWKNNIFFNCFRLQKIGTNNTREFDVTDNLINATIADFAVDATDKSKFATEDTELVFEAPTAQSVNFATTKFLGDPRWCPAFYKASTNQVINMSNTLTNKVTKEGAPKYGINENYPWIVYDCSNSILDNGKCEVSRGGIYVSINPVTFENDGTFTYMVDDQELWLGTPKVEFGYVKDGEFKTLISKHLTYNVKNAQKVDLLLTGGGSNTNVADVVVYDAVTNEIVQAITSVEMPGKSNKANEANTKSCVVSVENLDPSKIYNIVVAPALSATTVEINGSFVAVPTEATNGAKDIDVAGKNVSNIKSPAVYVAAVRIISETKPASMYHAPAVPESADFETVLGAEMVTQINKNIGAQTKWGINDYLTWITYSNNSKLDDGTSEVQVSNRWTDYDPAKGGIKGDFVQPKYGSNVNAPVLHPEAGNDKFIEFAIEGTALFRAYGAGSASGSAADGNYIKATATPVAGGDAITAQSVEGGIYGKGTASDIVELVLDPAKQYVVKVEAAVKDVELTGINLYTTAALQQAAKGGVANGIQNVNAAAATKVAKRLVNGQIVIETVNGTYSVTGAQMK